MMGVTFSKVVIFLDFAVNKNYIATTLCENRNKPSCCCHGTCFLKKQLQKEEGKNAQNFSKDRFEATLFFESNEQNLFSDFKVKKIYNTRYCIKKYSTLLSSVFHPPGTTT